VPSSPYTSEDWDNLFQLQELEKAYRDLLAQQERVPGKLEALQRKYTTVEEKLEAIKTTLLNLRSEVDNLEAERSSAETRLSRLKSQQMEVKTNEAFAAMSREIEDLQNQIDCSETALLEKMMELDEAEKKRLTDSKPFEEQKTQLAKEMEQVRAESLNLEKMAAEALEKRKAFEAGVSESLRGTFFRLAARIHLPVVVPLKGKHCGGCFIQVASDTLDQLKRGDSLTFCYQCGRLLSGER